MKRYASIALALMLAACTTQKQKEKEAKKEELAQQARLSVIETVANTNGAVRNMAARISVQTNDPVLRRFLVMWQLRVQEVTRHALSQPDLRWAFLDLWSLAIQMRNFFAKPIEAFGEFQGIAVEGTRDLVQSYAKRAQSVLSPEVFEQVNAGVEEFAKRHPISGKGMRQSHTPIRAKAEGSSKLVAILKAPLSVFSLGSGVTDTARAISQVAGSVDRIGYMVNDIPSTARMQMELLLFDLHENPTVAGIMKDTDRLSRSIDSIAKSADRLPKDVEEIVRTTAKEIEGQQKELQATLKEARGVVDQTLAAVSTMKDTVKEVEATAKEIDVTANSLTKTGEAWLPTIKEINLLINPPPEENPDPNEEKAPPFDFKDVVKASRNFTEAAVELRGLVAEAQALIGSDDISKRIDDLDLAAGKATSHGEAFTTHLMFCAMGVILAFFGVLFAYKLALKRFG